MNNNIVIEKFRLFFKDLIVLGRETLWCYEKNLVMPLIYELFENLDENKWYHFLICYLFHLCKFYRQYLNICTHMHFAIWLFVKQKASKIL